jgi:hypothetical protein
MFSITYVCRSYDDAWCEEAYLSDWQEVTDFIAKNQLAKRVIKVDWIEMDSTCPF